MITTSINKLFSDPKSLPKNPFPRIIKQVSSILINDEANQNNKKFLENIKFQEINVQRGYSIHSLSNSEFVVYGLQTIL